jgi:hypothetical protein
MALVLTVLCSLSFTAGEEGPVSPAAPGSEDENPLQIIPLSPFLEALSSGEVFWRPDWPAGFPPDAFFVNSGRPLSIVLRSGEDTLTFRRDGQGRLRDFPLFFNGAFFQVQAAYDAAGRIQRLALSSAGESLIFDFPEDFLTPGNTAPVRVNRAGTWCFALVLETGPALSETWYDQEGQFLAWYQARIRRDGPSWRIRSLEFRGQGAQSRESFDFDSGGNITGVNSPRGEFSARCRGGRPVYWDRAPAVEPVSMAAPAAPAPAGVPAANTAEAPVPPESPPPAGISAAGMPEQSGSFILQWDERGFLTGKRPQGEETGGEFRYEYETDSRGNWIRRQDIEMVGLEDLVFPLSRGQYERQIIYVEE